MKIKVATSILCKFRNEPSAVCRGLPRCRFCGRVLHVAEIHSMTCAACRRAAGDKAVNSRIRQAVKKIKSKWDVAPENRGAAK